MRAGMHDDHVGRTVLGDIPAGELGITLAHEHIFLDLRNQFTEPTEPGARERSKLAVDASQRSLLERNPYAIADNLVLDDDQVAIDELRRFSVVGGRTVVDCTPHALGRDPERLRRVAAATGLNVIAGCGFYTADTLPPDFDGQAVDILAAGMVAELTVGIGGSGVPAGVIGEIGTSAELHPAERKSLMAAGLAHREVPAAIHVHTFPWARIAPEAIDILVSTGVDPAKIVIDHLDVDIDQSFIEEILQRGVVAEFDCWGKEYRLDASDGAFAPGPFATDVQRADTLAHLLERGYARQLLIATDICFKTLLYLHGGKGYAHIVENVIPMLEERGADAGTIRTLLVENPARTYALGASHPGRE